MSETIVGAEITSAPSNIDIVKRLLNTHYGEDYVDFQYVEDLDFYRVFILIPSITIRNDEEETYILKDVYVGFILKSDGTFRSGTFKVNRGSLSPGEVAARYKFSHSTWNRDNGDNHLLNSFDMDYSRDGDLAFLQNWQHCCYGEGTIQRTMANLSNSFDIAYWMLFINELNAYLSYEDLNGGPYRRMSSISINSDKISTDKFLFESNYIGGTRNLLLTNDLMKAIIMKILPSLRISVSVENSKVIPVILTPIETIELIVTEYLLSKNIDSLYFCKKSMEGKYYKAESIRRSSSTVSLDLGFMFKGEKAKVTIGNTVDSCELTSVIHPHVTGVILRFLYTFIGVNATKMNFFDLYNDKTNTKD